MLAAAEQKQDQKKVPRIPAQQNGRRGIANPQGLRLIHSDTELRTGSKNEKREFVSQKNMLRSKKETSPLGAVSQLAADQTDDSILVRDLQFWICFVWGCFQNFV